MRNQILVCSIILAPLLLPTIPVVASSEAPHIVLVVVDDLGSRDLGYHGSGILTPTIDGLAESGVLLENYYVLPYCSPTRAALLSGRYPLHTGCHEVINSVSTDGLPLQEETLPQVLRRAGYLAHAVGKWHLGHSKWEQTPTFRGFQSFFGYYLGWSDYFTHYTGCSAGEGYDLHWDKHEFCGPSCSVFPDERGNYSTRVFTERAVNIIRSHDQEDPLFLYIAYQGVHSPNEVPLQYSDMYKNRNWTSERKLYAGMLTSVDEGIGNVTAALKSARMWDNTVIVVTTDNGGPTEVCSVQGSSNRGRGGKCTIWEGGTAGDAVFHGLSATSNYKHLFHVVDWLPTLARLANATPNGKPLDGVDQLDGILGKIRTHTREEAFIGYAAFEGNWYGPALRWKNWKLIQGSTGGPDSQHITPPGTAYPASGGDIESTFLLFDVVRDPHETTNLASVHPLLVEILRGKLKQYQETFVPPIEPNFECGQFDGIKRHPHFGPTWTPWCSKVVYYT